MRRARPGSGAGVPEPVREHIVPDHASAIRWFEHDYPHPLARWHHHPEIEIHRIRASSGTAMLGGAARAFGPGDLAWIGPDVPHDWVSVLDPGETVPGRDVLIQVGAASLDGLVSSLPDLAGLAGLFEDGRGAIVFHGRTAEAGGEMIEQLGALHGTRRAIGVLQLLEVLAAAPPHEAERIDTTSVQLPAEDADRFAAVLAHIHDHLAAHLTLGDVAAAIGVSPSTASRLFTRATGVGFSRTLNRLRISEATRLLLTTELRVADLAWQVGYTNLSSFNRRFLEEVGTTPLRYRRTRTRPGHDGRHEHPRSPAQEARS